MLGRVSLAKEMTKIMRKYKHEKDGYFYIVEDLATARKIIDELKAIEGLSLSIIHDCKSKEIQIVNRKNSNGFRVIHYKINNEQQVREWLTQDVEPYYNK